MEIISKLTFIKLLELCNHRSKLIISLLNYSADVCYTFKTATLKEAWSRIYSEIALKV